MRLPESWPLFLSKKESLILQKANMELVDRFGSVEASVPQILLSGDSVQAKVEELARQINHDYSQEHFTLVVLLNGGLRFFSDLYPHLEGKPTVKPWQVASYASTVSTGQVESLSPVPNVEGERVIVIEDIIDTGRTMGEVCSKLMAQNPKQLEVCSLLKKRGRYEGGFLWVLDHLRYLGFEIPDLFVVGYGLDYQEVFRDLPFIGVLKPDTKRVVDGVWKEFEDSI